VLQARLRLALTHYLTITSSTRCQAPRHVVLDRQLSRCYRQSGEFYAGSDTNQGRYCHAHQSDARHRGTSGLDFRGRSAQYPLLGKPGRMGGQALRVRRRSGRKRQAREIEIVVDTTRVLERPCAPDPLRLHATALLMAQPGGVLIFDTIPTPAQAQQFRLTR